MFLNSRILRILELLVFIYAIYRVLSKDKYKRQKVVQRAFLSFGFSSVRMSLTIARVSSPLFPYSFSFADWVVETAAHALTSKVLPADSARRAAIHLSGVFACNFANHMYALSAHLLEKHGLPFDAMLPLIDETARKVHGLHPRNAQTGPAVRKDGNVMNKHLEMLVEEPELREIYKMISYSISHSERNEV